MSHYLEPKIPPNDSVTRIVVECYLGWGMGYTAEGFARFQALREKDPYPPLVIRRRTA